MQDRKATRHSPRSLAALGPAPLVPRTVRLSSVISALSHALDLTEGQPPGHCMRTCWIGFQIGQHLGLSGTVLWELYYTLLLKDAGCSSNAERLCELYANDDGPTKRDFSRVDTDSLKQLSRFVLTHTAPGARLSERLTRIMHLLRHGERLADELVMTRCERGAAVALQLGFPETVADAVRNLDEHWDGNGRPAKLAGECIPLGSRIALAAQVADVFYQAGGHEAARKEIRRRRGTWFDPRVVDAFCAVAQSPAFWDPLGKPGFAERLWDLEPGKQVMDITEPRMDAIALAFAQIVDAKSHFTYGHSERVGQYANAISLHMGHSEVHTAWIRRGALLHDLGKLGVSNTVLNKPGSLNASEWAQIKRHPALTENILTRIEPFKKLAHIAGAHHERMDGYGYPRGLEGDEICLETRIITTADIFDALTATRPYRDALSIEQAFSIMGKETGTAIDATCLEALRATVTA